MSTALFWEEIKTGLIFAVLVADHTVVGAVGPLTENYTRPAWLDRFGYELDLGAYIDQQQENYRPFQPAA